MSAVLRRLDGPRGAVSTLLRTRQAAAGAVVLAYHDVLPAGAPPTPLQVTAGQLRSHILLLRRAGCEIVTLSTLIDRLLAGGTVDRLAALTFDDALVGVLRHGLEVLEAEAAPATILPVVGRLGAAPDWWPGTARTMNGVELHEAISAGVEVAAHTRTHPSLPSLDARALRAELRDGRHELEQLLGRRVDLLAYPYGHHDPAVRDATREAGFRAAFTFLNGRITPGVDAYRLPRLTAGPALGACRLLYHVVRPAGSWPAHDAEVVLDGGPAVSV